MSFAAVTNGHVALPNIGFALDQIRWLSRASETPELNTSHWGVVRSVARHYGIDRAEEPGCGFGESREGFRSLCIVLNPYLSNALLARAHSMNAYDVKEYGPTLSGMKKIEQFGIIARDAAEIAMTAAAALRPDLFSPEEPAIKRMAEDLKTLIRVFNSEPELRQNPDFYFNGFTLQALKMLGATISINELAGITDANTLWRFFPEAQQLLHARLAHIIENESSAESLDNRFGITSELLQRAFETGIIGKTFYHGAITLISGM